MLTDARSKISSKERPLKRVAYSQIQSRSLPIGDLNPNLKQQRLLTIDENLVEEDAAVMTARNTFKVRSKAAKEDFVDAALDQEKSYRNDEEDSQRQLIVHNDPISFTGKDEEVKKINELDEIENEFNSIMDEEFGFDKEKGVQREDEKLKELGTSLNEAYNVSNGQPEEADEGVDMKITDEDALGNEEIRITDSQNALLLHTEADNNSFLSNKEKPGEVRSTKGSQTLTTNGKL